MVKLHLNHANCCCANRIEILESLETSCIGKHVKTWGKLCQQNIDEAIGML